MIDLFKQRSRWFIGTLNLIRHTSPVTKLATILRVTSWVLAVVAGPVATVMWYTSPEVSIPLSVRLVPLTAGVVYGGTYLYGTYRLRSWYFFPMLLAIPLCALLEAVSPVYAVLFSDNDFTVIEK
ncbi:MAG: hypothetical protein SV760_08395 [Halobacteria archaeon]|nr:hypothetical protein [Halobacteria archaeon]